MTNENERGTRRRHYWTMGAVLVCVAGCEGTQRDYSVATESARPAAVPMQPGAAEVTPQLNGSAPMSSGDEGPQVQGLGQESGPSSQLGPSSSGQTAGATADAGPLGCLEGAMEACGPPREEGVCKFGQHTCSAGEFGECQGAVQAGPRDCTSSADNDCDGQPDDTLDEVCHCAQGSTQSCETHAGLDGKGQCTAGQQSCVLGAGNGTSDWGECTGSVGPGASDSCQTAGNDANCDGTPNGGCTCVEGATQPCGPDTDVGICQRGVSTCRNGAFQGCEGAVFRATRDCSSAQDNDCDGRPDNAIDDTCRCAIGAMQPCGTHPGRDGNGACRAGVQVCQAGAQNVTSGFGACNGSIGPAQRDTCVANDDSDCSGTRNDGCQCIIGGGNAPCSGDANNSRCSPQGTCAPCQANADCSLVSGGRSLCSAGRCVAPRCGDGVTTAAEACDDGNGIDTDGCNNACQPGLNLPPVTLQRFTWTSRQAPVDMGTTMGRACFLTRVGGAFNAAGDSVQIVSQGGRWMLTGTAASGFVEARAACMAAAGVTEEVSWQAGQDSIPLQAVSTHACFLTAARGAFQGGSEAVTLSRADDPWQLRGNSGQDGLGGSARCALLAPPSASFGMQFSTPSPLVSDAVQDGACYLTFLCGDFGAEGDLVETEWNGVGWELRRQVGGTRSLRANAVCIGRNDGRGVPAL